MPLQLNELQAIAAIIRGTLDSKNVDPGTPSLGPTWHLPARRPFAFCVIPPRFTNQPDQVFWTASPLDGTRAPHSSVVRLLQTLTGWNHPPRDERYHAYVYSSDDYPWTPMCDGMRRFLRFSATLEPRVQPVPGPEPRGSVGHGVVITEIVVDPASRSELDAFAISPAGPAPVGVDLIDAVTIANAHSKQSTLHRIYMMAAFALVAGRPESRAHEGHNIGAVLVSRQGRILSWGLNQSNQNNSFHAEVNTLQAYWKRTETEVPAGSVLFTTLKPCGMCAGMIAHTGVQRVYVGQDDPGSHARNTALDGSQPQKLFFLSEDATKPARVHTVNRYDAAGPKANIKHQDLTKTLEKIHADSPDPLITKTINANGTWKAAVCLTSRTLLRKVHKYSGEHARNPTVFGVVWHVGQLVAAHGNQEYQFVFKLFLKPSPPGGLGSASVTSPVISPLLDDSPMDEATNPFGSFDVQRQHLAAVQGSIRARLDWELDYGVGPLFDQRLSGQPGQFARLRARLADLIVDEVARIDVSAPFNPWTFHEAVVARLVAYGDEFCRALGV